MSDDDGSTLLSYVTSRGHVAVASYFREQGAI